MSVSAVFIVGMPRSGTTLLSTMLDAHSDLSISPETHFFTKCPVATHGLSPWVRDEAFRFLENQSGVQDMALPEEVWTALRDSAGSAPSDVFAALLRAYADRAGASVSGEKTPDHLAHVPEMAERFPGARFVAITRDPRDVYLSQKPMTWNRDTIVETAWTWRRYAKQVQTYRSAFAGRFYDLRYEDLLARPADELAALCTFLGVPFETGMLAFYKKADDALSAEPWKRNTRRPLDPSNREVWRVRLPPARRWIIQAVASSAMQAFGYPTPPVRMNAAYWRDALHVVAESIAIVARRHARKWR
jgi:LPS sulfotransferase NodH